MPIGTVTLRMPGTKPRYGGNSWTGSMKRRRQGGKKPAAQSTMSSMQLGPKPPREHRNCRTWVQMVGRKPRSPITRHPIIWQTFGTEYDPRTSNIREAAEATRRLQHDTRTNAAVSGFGGIGQQLPGPPYRSSPCRRFDSIRVRRCIVPPEIHCELVTSLTSQARPAEWHRDASQAYSMSEA
jgi:hypothetical protein